MNGYYYNPGQGYHAHGYMQGMTYPARIQCPYCMNLFDVNIYMTSHSMEYDPVNTGYAWNSHENVNQPEYGYDNIYPVSDNTSPAYCNKSGYICPNENICSPWDNNKMYAPADNNFPEQNP